MKTLSGIFAELRNDKDHHIGLGDIRLTVGQQDEIASQFLPLEFVEWIGENANMLYFPNSNGRWLLSRLVMGENPSVEYDEYTTAELFEYWKQNVEK